MAFRNRSLAWGALLSLNFGSAGCSDSDAPSSTAGCDVTVSPSDDADAIRSVIDAEVKTGSTLCFSPGVYDLKKPLVLTGAANVTFKGTGAKRDAVVLDFTNQLSGKEGVSITTPGFTIENLSVKNTVGNGVQVQADDSVFRNIKVGWDTPSDAENNPLSGGYAIYPTGCKNTLIEDSEVYGASDAGIYAGQCEHVVARRNDSHGNVLGIEIENTTGADLYDNDVHGNTTGFLIDLLPNLQKKNAENYLVRGNHIHDNDRPNFAEKNSTASTAPAGTGILVLAVTNAEIESNVIENNDSAAVMIVSYDIIDIIAQLNGGQPSEADPETPRWPHQIYVHDNQYVNNGQEPKESLAILAQGPEGKKTVDYAVLWDGILSPGTADAAAAKICLGAPESSSFLNFQAATSGFDPSKFTTDTKDHRCSLSVSRLAP